MTPGVPPEDGDRPAPDQPQPKPERPGKRFGPFVWVPEIASTGEDDPWKHRKGEPRIFTLIWTGYLLLAAFGTLLSAQALGAPRAGQFGWGARSLLVLMALGIVVLWPATRLSQSLPQRPCKALLADLFVVMLPVFAILIPLPLMTGWSFPVAGGLGVMLLSWSTVAAALIWLGWRGGTAWSRGMATLGGVAVAAAGPALEIFLVWLGYTVRPWWVGMASPTSAVFVLTDAPSGLAIRMEPAEWLASVLPMGLAAVLVALGLVGGKGGHGARARTGAS